MIVLAVAFAAQLSSVSGDVTTLVTRARAARLQQDSLLASYEAEVRQRFSAGMGLSIGQLPLTPIGRNRLAARIESVARVGWSQQFGAWGEVLAARSVVPILGKLVPEPENEDAAIVLPYYPGRDRLWPTDEVQQALPRHDEWIAHPLMPGADSIYEFSLGDSLNIRLPDSRVVRVREIRVQPRRPASRLIVGSLWVDVQSGSLVRAAYRPSVPMDLWPFIEREVGRNDRDKVKKFGPFTGTIREIIVDHGLYDGRFWLPRTRVATAEGTGTGGRVELSIEQTFRYKYVKALPPGVAPLFLPDTISDVDTRTGRVRYPKWNGVEERTSACRATGDTNTVRWSADSLARDGKLTVVAAQGIRVRVLMPCDPGVLTNSPLLPKSIYSPGEDLFPETDFQALRKEAEGALAISKQAKWNPQPLVVHYGIDRGMLRYNRVEGLSAGLMLERALGRGYDVGGWARIGVADHEPRAQLFLKRSNTVTELRGAAYNRLDVANDWGDALGLGASVSALLFARDDGFYYRNSGTEVGGTHRGAASATTVSWRLFGEYHHTAKMNTQRSLANVVSDTKFGPNIQSLTGAYWGGATTVSYAVGVNPQATRVTGNTRLELATGEASYVRGMSELTLSHGLFSNASVSVTTAAGSSVGTLPAERSWYLGGPYTVHAQPSGTASGNSFWLARSEFSVGHPFIRPILFADVGWAGARNDWRRGEGAISGVGVGASIMDGMVRLDFARGLQTQKRWRVDFYFEVR